MDKPAIPCPCQSGKTYVLCCGQYIEGDIVAPTAETLMRSRYTAYTYLNENYLLNTWHSSTRPTHLSLKENQPDKWLGLKIINLVNGGIHDQLGCVEFVARYKTNGKAGRLHEISEFVYESGQWFYVRAQAQSDPE